jgi:hypothetical protein
MAPKFTDRKVIEVQRPRTQEKEREKIFDPHSIGRKLQARRFKMANDIVEEALIFEQLSSTSDRFKDIEEMQAQIEKL